ncbi:MAG: SPOUT family RNA methylase [Thaumarchaeota archaeon]|nr:SPOUT family RNA methylase [Nitrososphaerota archaeon]
MRLIVKTPLDLEDIVAARIVELDPVAEVRARPGGLKGLVIVESCHDAEMLKGLILREIPEAESVIKVDAVVEADLDRIVEAVVNLARDVIREDDSFAVRTVRRGRHDFTSLDVNVRVGAAVQAETGARVDLENPDVVIYVEIVLERAGISIVRGEREWRKMTPEKRPSFRIFNRISIVQMPYLGSIEGAREIGRRIGRAVQSYEVGELIIAPNKPVDAFELEAFIAGVREGVESRYAIQKKTYARSVEKVRVLVQDLYQLVRERREEPMIVLEPEGLQIRDALPKLRELFSRGGRVNLLIGSREGIPKGVYRIASLVLDLAPGITLSTELAAPSTLATIYTALNIAGDA